MCGSPLWYQMAVLSDVFKEFVPTSNCLRERFRAKAMPYASRFETRVIDKEMNPPEVSIAVKVVCRITLISPY